MEKRINGHTRLYALIGSPVGHSGSPAMQNYSFEKLGIDAAYLAFDVNVGQTAKALEAFRTLNVGGFNVTMPCKTEVARLVDRLSPAAELIGACNTVVVEEDGTMTGHITDGTGFVRNLKEHSVEVKDQKIVVLGTGGAATAIAVQAALDGVAEIAIFNRKDEFFANGEKTVEKIKKAVPTIGKVYIEDLDNTEKLRAVIAESDILINATPMTCSGSFSEFWRSNSPGRIRPCAEWRAFPVGTCGFSARRCKREAAAWRRCFRSRKIPGISA